EFLYSNDKIAEVQVFGIPYSKMGEEICAWAQLYPGEAMTEEELKDFCRGQITHFKIPRRVRFVDEFPMTVTSKIQKFVMREQMAAELG
ncbi:MAG: AMP-binding protein, partial [Halioglobus sp.]